MSDIGKIAGDLQDAYAALKWVQHLRKLSEQDATQAGNKYVRAKVSVQSMSSGFSRNDDHLDKLVSALVEEMLPTTLAVAEQRLEVQVKDLAEQLAAAATTVGQP